MIATPPRLLGTLVGVFIVAISGILAFAILSRFLAEPPSLGAWALLVTGGALAVVALSTAFQTWCLLTMRYAMTEGKLLIRWGPRTIVVPLRQVSRMAVVRDLNLAVPVRTWWWPGHYRCDVRVVGVGETHVYATSRARGDMVLVVAGAESYVISPPNAGAWLRAFEEEQARGLLAEPEVRYPGLLRMAFWTDRPLQWLSIGCLALALISLGLVFYQYPVLPESLPTRFGPLGEPTAIQGRQDVFRIAYGAIGAMIAAVTAGLIVRNRDRLAAYLSVGGGLGVQVLFLLAIGGVVLRF